LAVTQTRITAKAANTQLQLEPTAVAEAMVKDSIRLQLARKLATLEHKASSLLCWVVQLATQDKTIIQLPLELLQRAEWDRAPIQLPLGIRPVIMRNKARTALQWVLPPLGQGKAGARWQLVHPHAAVPHRVRSRCQSVVERVRFLLKILIQLLSVLLRADKARAHEVWLLVVWHRKRLRKARTLWQSVHPLAAITHKAIIRLRLAATRVQVAPRAHNRWPSAPRRAVRKHKAQTRLQSGTGHAKQWHKVPIPW
jgi:hypothetical protein